MLVSFLVLPLVASFDLFKPLSLEASSNHTECATFVCTEPSNSQELMSTCITYDNSTNVYELIPCHHIDRLENYCPSTTDVTQLPAVCSAPATQYPKLYPGEGPCTDNTNCNKGTCTYGMCVGKDVGKTCYSNTDCNSGLRCVTRKCTALLAEGEIGCKVDQDCVNTSGCDFNVTSAVGTCVEYLSKTVGETIETCNNFVSLLCESAQCFVKDNIATCIEAIKNSEDTPLACEADSDCYGEVNGVKLYGKCECGYTEKGNSYCASFIGDKEGQRYLGELRNWLDSIKIVSCHTERRFEPLCMKDWNTERYDIYKLRQLTYNTLPQLQKNSECVQKIYTASYWDSKSDYSYDTETPSDMSQYLTCMLVWVVLLLVN